MVPNVMKSIEGWELYIVTDGVIVGILLGEGFQCESLFTLGFFTQ
jgi:hypothetical protein